MTTKTEGSAALAGPRPKLWWTESALSNAITYLETTDPEARMSDEEAQHLIANFVGVETVAERRDEFADFLLEGEAFVNAKLERAQAIMAQAKAVESGLQRMREEALKLMKAAGVKALVGKTYTLKAKDSPGAVEVTNEAEIPAEFFRTKEDVDGGRIKRLADIAKMLITSSYTDQGVIGEGLEAALNGDEMLAEVDSIRRDAEADRRAVDKKAIAAEWKANGETRETVNADTGEVLEVPMVPGARKLVTTKLVVA